MKSSISAARASRAAQSLPQTTHRIAIIGLGYVGLPLAIRAAEKYSTIGFDVDTEKIQAINARDIAFITDDERSSLKKITLTATNDVEELRSANVYIICVPTPVSDTHEPDLEPLKSAARTVARVLKKNDLVVIESTVNPGVCEEVVLPILEGRSSRTPAKALTVERDFYLAHCPERINPGDSHWNVRTIPRVIGGAGPESLKRALELYTQLIEAPLTPMHSLKEAEAVKMVENAFRDVNIAFVNELAMAFDRAGIDLVNVINGASSKPFSFMPHFPGAGVGGHCIPVDPYYLIRYGERNGFVHKFLITAREINNRMPHYTVTILSQALRRRRKQLRGATIALLGLAYKKDIGDERESPAHVIRDVVKRRGAKLRIYDPHVPDGSTHHSLKETLQGADAVIIATDHAEFRTLTPYHFMQSGVDVVVDGRNCLRKEDFAMSGIIYSGIGRA